MQMTTKYASEVGEDKFSLVLFLVLCQSWIFGCAYESIELCMSIE